MTGTQKYGYDNGAHQFLNDPRDILLSLHVDFRFVRAAVACAILEKTNVFESCIVLYIQ